MGLIVQWETTGDRTRVASEQNADLVFGLLHELLAEDDLSLSLLQEQLRLVHVRDCTVTTFKLDGVQPDRISVVCDVPLGEVKLIVELPQPEICGRHVGNQGCLDNVSSIGG